MGKMREITGLIMVFLSEPGTCKGLNN